MGYNTQFKLKVEPLEELTEVEQLRLELGMKEKDSNCYGIPLEDLNEADRMKWYEYDKEMRAFSAKHPKVLFTLSGEGEEAGDLWVSYYVAGKCQRCEAQIIYDDFDPEKLR